MLLIEAIHSFSADASIQKSSYTLLRSGTSGTPTYQEQQSNNHRDLLSGGFVFQGLGECLDKQGRTYDRLELPLRTNDNGSLMQECAIACTIDNSFLEDSFVGIEVSIEAPNGQCWCLYQQHHNPAVPDSGNNLPGHGRIVNSDGNSDLSCFAYLHPFLENQFQYLGAGYCQDFRGNDYESYSLRLPETELALETMMGDLVWWSDSLCGRACFDQDDYDATAYVGFGIEDELCYCYYEAGENPRASACDTTDRFDGYGPMTSIDEDNFTNCYKYVRPKNCVTVDALADPGYDSDIHRGWYDVDGCGTCNQFCRWVGNSGHGPDPSVATVHRDSFWACQTADDEYNRYFDLPWTAKRCSGPGATPP